MGCLNCKDEALFFSIVTLVVLNQVNTFSNPFPTQKCPPFECRQPTSDTCLQSTECSHLLRPRQKRQLGLLLVLSGHTRWKTLGTY